jgi:hypothetical protein
MIDRSFNETDLREMLERAVSYAADVVTGRFIVQTTHRMRAWEVVVEPQRGARILIAVTAYPMD